MNYKNGALTKVNYLVEIRYSSLHNFFFKIFIVIQLQLCAFSPHPSTPPHPNTPPSPTSTLDFVHVSFKVVPVIPSPHCPLPTPLWLLLDCS